MIRPPRSLESQSWDYAEPPVACVACGKDECGCGEDPLYGCDSCNAMLPSDELHHVRNNSVGEGHFCDACLAPAYAVGRKR